MQPFEPEQHDHATQADALMSAEQQEMEAMLIGLALREPSAKVDARVRGVLAQHDASTLCTASAAPASGPLAKLRPTVGLALAAGVALAAGLGIALYAAGPDAPTLTAQRDAAPPDPLAQAGPGTAPGDATTVAPVSYNFDQPPVNLRWSRDYDRGLLTAADGRRYRAYLRQTIDQSTYVDPDAQATMQLAEPSQAYIIVPVLAY